MSSPIVPNATRRSRSTHINGVVGSVDMPVTIPTSISVDESLTCGRDAASPVSSLYEAPFDFTGTLERVTVDVTADKIKDHEAEIHKAFARQ